MNISKYWAQAVVTRNSYGSLVLDASRGMFVDIDVPHTHAFQQALP